MQAGAEQQPPSSALQTHGAQGGVTLFGRFHRPVRACLPYPTSCSQPQLPIRGELHNCTSEFACALELGVTFDS